MLNSVVLIAMCVCECVCVCVRVCFINQPQPFSSLELVKRFFTVCVSFLFFFPRKPRVSIIIHVVWSSLPQFTLAQSYGSLLSQLRCGLADESIYVLSWHPWCHRRCSANCSGRSSSSHLLQGVCVFLACRLKVWHSCCRTRVFIGFSVDMATPQQPVGYEHCWTTVIHLPMFKSLWERV